MLNAKYLGLGLLLFLVVGCSRTTTESTEQEPAPAAEQSDIQPVPDVAPQAAESTPQPAAPAPSRTVTRPKESSQPAREASPARSTREGRVASPSNPPLTPAEPALAPTGTAAKAPAAPVAPEPRYAMIPSGTKFHVRLQEPLNTSVNKSGDTFSAILDEAIQINGNVVAPRGSIVEGKLPNVERAGRVEGRAKMSLQLVSLAIGNQSYPVETEILAFEAESTVKKDATKVGLGAGIGAVIGAIAGGGKGAAIGAAVGGGAGGATVIATRGKELEFEAEHQFSFELRNGVEVRLE